MKLDTSWICMFQPLGRKIYYFRSVQLGLWEAFLQVIHPQLGQYIHGHILRKMHMTAHLTRPHKLALSRNLGLLYSIYLYFLSYAYANGLTTKMSETFH